MKILNISATDIYGGAAVAAYQLHTNLINHGIDSMMLVNYKYSKNNKIICLHSYRFTKIIRKFLPHIENSIKLLFGESLKLDKLLIGWFTRSIKKHTNWADIIIVHYISGSFLTLNQLVEIDKPCIWLMHDMFSMTGGCHYSEGCKNYITGCGYCKYIKQNSASDDSNKNVNYKRLIYSKINNVFVAPSKWLYHESKNSFLLKDQIIEYIPYSINEIVYFKKDTVKIRKDLFISNDKTVILFSANGNISDKRKGLDLLFLALNSLSQIDKDKYFLLIVGTEMGLNLSSLDIKYKIINRVSEAEIMANLYNAADILVIPSREDNLPNTVLESLFCETPVLAFNVGGMPDMITHKVNGYLADPYSVNDFTNGIKYLTENIIGYNSFKEVKERFSSKNQIKKFKIIFKRLIN
jgi:glycosyltransferase involved in cell wall biosynthesis